MLLMPDLVGAEWFSGLGFLFSLFIPIGLLKMAISTKGEIRRRVIYVFTGFLLFMFAGLIVGEIPILFLTSITSWSRYVIHIFSNGGQILASLLFMRGYL